MKNDYFEKFEKAKQEFISKRCDEANSDVEKNESFQILQMLMDKLKYEEKNLFMQYTEAVNIENFKLEEKIYSLGFADGVTASLARLKN